MKIERKHFKKIVKSFITFVLIEIGNIILDYALYLIFNYIFLVSIVLSQIISYSLATVNRYIFTKFIKFGGKPTAQVLSVELPRFIVVSLLNLGLSVALMFVLYSVVGYNDLISKAVVTLSTSTLNGLSYNFIVFKDNKNGSLL